MVPYGPAGLDGRVQVLFVFISIPFLALAGALPQAPQVGDVILSVDSEIVAGMVRSVLSDSSCPFGLILSCCSLCP